MLMALLMLVQNASAPVADDAPHPIFDRMAETIVAAAPEAGNRHPEGWLQLGQRARSVHWHLAEPDDGDGWYRRTGWISAEGRQVGVAACGGADGVAALGLEFPGETAEPLLAALRAHGRVEPTITHHRSALWVEPEGHEWLLLYPESVCTPEGSAAARTCRMHVLVSIAPMTAGQSCLAP